MAQIFPKKANALPALSLMGATLGGVLTVALVWYYFSPEFIDVGYAPEQPVPYSHRFHVDELGLDCRYCHTNVEVSAIANLPATQTCMNCHGQVKTESLKLVPISRELGNRQPG